MTDKKSTAMTFETLLADMYIIEEKLAAMPDDVVAHLRSTAAGLSDNVLAPLSHLVAYLEAHGSMWVATLSENETSPTVSMTHCEIVLDSDGWPAWRTPKPATEFSSARDAYAAVRPRVPTLSVDDSFAGGRRLTMIEVAAIYPDVL